VYPTYYCITSQNYARRCRILLPTESCGLSVCLPVCHLVSPAKTAKAIEMPFASRTRVGPRKHLLHIADRFETNAVLCSFNTIQPSSYRISTKFTHKSIYLNCHRNWKIFKVRSSEVHCKSGIIWEKVQDRHITDQ